MLTISPFSPLTLPSSTFQPIPTCTLLFFISYAAHLFISVRSFTGRWSTYSCSPRSRQLVLVSQLEARACEPLPMPQC